MASELLRTPHCNVTGMPLPILPNEPHLTGVRFNGGPNWHHHFHPARHPMLNTMGGIAVRKSRIQKVNYALHTNYHELFDGPELPDNEDDAFRIAVTGAAGVVPRQAIDVSRRGRYKIVDLPSKTHQELTNEKSINIDGSSNLALFFADYAAKQNVKSTIDDILIDEFLDQKTLPKRKKEIASMMLSQALSLSLQPLDRSYMYYRKDGYLRLNKPETFHRVTKRLIRRHALPYFSTVIADKLLV